MAFGPQDVSICIPTFERGPVLVATLEALVGQAWIPLKLLGELRVAARGLRLARRGPRLLTTTSAP